MEIELISQIEIGAHPLLRVGDRFNEYLNDERFDTFEFSVAYMRYSGISRLSESLAELKDRGGSISGAIGVDDAITSWESLDELLKLSDTSTIYHTTSGHIYHPKFYIFSGAEDATVVIGSANLTQNGLYRNVEIVNALHLDRTNARDESVFVHYKNIMMELLNPHNDNIQLLNATLINDLLDLGVIKKEKDTPEPGSTIFSKKSKATVPTKLKSMFPSVHIPPAPPVGKTVSSPSRRTPTPTTVRGPSSVPTPVAGTTSRHTTFVMKLSPFDCSHKTGTVGTPEILIPHRAMSFFPSIASRGNKYDDVYFDLILNTPSGKEVHEYRLWYYDYRANGKKIDENRLRMDHDTIDLTTSGGGDLIVINKLPLGTDPEYEVTIVKTTDLNHSHFLSLCTELSQDKYWGLV